MFKALFNEFMMEEYDWFKYVISEVSIDLHGFMEGGER